MNGDADTKPKEIFPVVLEMAPNIPWAVSVNYVTRLLWPVLVAGGAFVVSPFWASVSAGVATAAWAVHVSTRVTCA